MLPYHFKILNRRNYVKAKNIKHGTAYGIKVKHVNIWLHYLIIYQWQRRHKTGHRMTQHTGEGTEILILFKILVAQVYPNSLT